MTFDAGGTLWIAPSVSVPGWLDRSAGGAGAWRFTPRVNGSLPTGRGILTLGGHPPGGPARADTVLFTYYGWTGRSVDGGVNWVPLRPEQGPRIGNHVLREIPPGYPRAGRILVGAEGADAGSLMGYSDDRGASWVFSVNAPPADQFAITELLVLPPPNLLPGAASGRAVTAPPGWPAGRVVAGGHGGLGYSDDGAASYRPSNWFGGARYGDRLALVRRPDSHPLGPGPRVLMVGIQSGDPAVSAWTSDDAGTTWTKRALLFEPVTAPGYGKTLGVFPLSTPGESDAGATGEAVTVLGLGHIYRTTDAGETWAVVGRAPAMVGFADNPPDGRTTTVGTAEMGPDGRLYVAVDKLGPGPGEWVYRTTTAFVADEASPSVAERLGVAVRPNPAGGRVEVVLVAASAGEARVVVVDALGREVAVALAGAVAAGETVRAVETAGWPPGVYVVRASVGGQTASARLVVAR